MIYRYSPLPGTYRRLWLIEREGLRAHPQAEAEPVLVIGPCRERCAIDTWEWLGTNRYP